MKPKDFVEIVVGALISLILEEILRRTFCRIRRSWREANNPDDPDPDLEDPRGTGTPDIRSTESSAPESPISESSTQESVNPISDPSAQESVSPISELPGNPTGDQVMESSRVPEFTVPESGLALTSYSRLAADNILVTGHRAADNNLEPSVPEPGLLTSKSANYPSYHVFLSFRGQDVRNTLAEEIYRHLSAFNLRVFSDQKQLGTGDFFPAAIQHAIAISNIHVAILSPGYAQSPWCLDELSFMLKTGAKIIPVFYGVKPSHLRYIESGPYKAAFEHYHRNNRFDLDIVEKWKETLYWVSCINGLSFDSSKDHEDILLKSIVDIVVKEANRTTSAWQTPLAENGKEGWELALVESASNLSKQQNKIPGAFDPSVLDGLYGQAAARQQFNPYVQSGSASSVATLPRPGAPSYLALPALPTQQGAAPVSVPPGGDPFAASLYVAPPPYVQMAEMTKKELLLVQEQQLWQQYQNNGMQYQNNVMQYPYNGMPYQNNGRPY